MIISQRTDRFDDLIGRAGRSFANFCKLCFAKANLPKGQKSCKISVMEIGKFSDHVTARILVVDDHPTTASTLARAIAQLGEGIETLAAVSGEEALALAKDKPVDVLITDMMMPGMNGLELIEQLQLQQGGPSFIFLITAFDMAGRKITAQRLKVNEIITKPVRPEKICQLVAGAVMSLKNSVCDALSEPHPELKSGWA